MNHLNSTLEQLRNDSAHFTIERLRSLRSPNNGDQRLSTFKAKVLTCLSSRTRPIRCSIFSSVRNIFPQWHADHFAFTKCFRCTGIYRPCHTDSRCKSRTIAIGPTHCGICFMDNNWNLECCCGSIDRSTYITTKTNYHCCASNLCLALCYCFAQAKWEGESR